MALALALMAGGATANWGINVLEFPNGRFGYIGRVPADILFIDPTPEQLEARKFGGRFGPKTRTFATRKDAVDFAEDHGYEVS